MANSTKTYFRRPGTVARWWHPEDEDDPLYDHFRQQLHWVVARQDWRQMRVLDIGTGKGRFAVPLAVAGAGVVALDISGEMLSIAQDAASDAGVVVRFLQGDAERLPFPDDTFDAVLCMEAIMHIPHPHRLLSEMARVVRPEGNIIVSMTNRWRLNALGQLPAHVYRWLGLVQEREGPRIMWSYSTRTFWRMLRDAGLQIVEMQGQGLLQPNARLWFTRQLSIPLIPPGLAKWFFTHVEPFFRSTPLLHVMGTVNVVARREARGTWYSVV